MAMVNAIDGDEEAQKKRQGLGSGGPNMGGIGGTATDTGTAGFAGQGRQTNDQGLFGAGSGGANAGGVGTQTGVDTGVESGGFAGQGRQLNDQGLFGSGSGGTSLGSMGSQAGGADTSGGANLSGVASQAGSGDLDNSFKSALISKLNAGPVSASDPSIAPAIQANRLAESRGLASQRNTLAEQAARDGTSGSGGFDAQVRGQEADSAMRQGQYNAGAIQHASDQQNQSLLAALGMAGDYSNQAANRSQQASQFGQSLGEQQAARAQQGSQFGQQLAQQGSQFGQTLAEQQAARNQQGSQFGQNLSEQARQANQAAELQKLGITTQGGLGQADINLRGRLGDQQSKLGLLSALMQNNQFGRSLDQQNHQFGASLDQSGILGMLGLL